MVDYFIIIDTQKGNKKSIYGFSLYGNIALKHLIRLYNIDPFCHAHRYSLEVVNYEPSTGIHLKD